MYVLIRWTRNTNESHEAFGTDCPLKTCCLLPSAALESRDASGRTNLASWIHVKALRRNNFVRCIFVHFFTSGRRSLDFVMFAIRLMGSRSDKPFPTQVHRAPRENSLHNLFLSSHDSPLYIWTCFLMFLSSHLTYLPICVFPLSPEGENHEAPTRLSLRINVAGCTFDVRDPFTPGFLSLESLVPFYPSSRHQPSPRTHHHVHIATDTPFPSPGQLCPAIGDAEGTWGRLYSKRRL